ncbi:MULTISPECIES: hypothetical protein [unclassified Pseudoalteromonas]|uniref:hypothetical protein n=1 Tax=unclassified Pseudoalteromonas TaxID=194690 RepID=UPI000F751DF6|nr:hypothetical protein [Pseudoalteromonas sp. Xi13]AZN32761.1 hypothetical protein EJ103_08480 [Pseudoalteromonas sp. Xi13]
MKIKLLSILVTCTLLPSLNVYADDNYTVSLQLLDSEKKEILSSSSLMLDTGYDSQTSSKSYAITECLETLQKKTRSFKSKEFIVGYSYSVEPQKGLVEFTEYGIDASKYNDYDKSECFRGEVKQIKHTKTLKVVAGNKNFQEFILPSGNFINVAIYK